MKNKEKMNKINNKMVGLNPTISIIPSNINELNKFLKMEDLKACYKFEDINAFILPF